MSKDLLLDHVFLLLFFVTFIGAIISSVSSTTPGYSTLVSVRTGAIAMGALFLFLWLIFQRMSMLLAFVIGLVFFFIAYFFI